MELTRKTRGFTLVELIIVIVLVGIVAAIVSMQLKPALESYLAVGRRANLADQADGALRRMVADARAAVPNSLRLHSAQCLEMVPTSDGGRLRTGVDVDPLHPDSKVFDPAAPGQEFDVLSELTAARQQDWIVMGNQSGNDVYGGTNSARIRTLKDSPSKDVALKRMSLDSALSLPGGYDGGRFVVVPQAQLGVSYVCVNPGISADGNGTGALLRVSGYDFRNRANAACPAAPADAPVVASKVASCNFIYQSGVTQQSGYVQLTLGLSNGGEAANLTVGAHVENVP